MKQNLSLNQNEQSVIIEDGNVKLKARLGVPPGVLGVVVFAHGSGSGRFSPRNNYVARVLQKVKIGTLLLDLLSETEELDRVNVFDIELLANRLIMAKSWLIRQPELRNLKIGYFGASTGAGAALVAAAKDPERVSAIVSRGGRADLAGKFLSQVGAPTLLVVGGNDDVVIDLNREAISKLQCKKQLKIIPGATHLFEESGALEEVAKLASNWFKKYLSEPVQEEIPVEVF